MPYYEASAKENISVDDAFVEMAKIAIKSAGDNQIFIPDSISGASGALKLNARDDQNRSKAQVKSKMCDCWSCQV